MNPFPGPQAKEAWTVTLRSVCSIEVFRGSHE